MTAGDFLFGIDLEDVRDHVQDGHGYAERVPANTERYLEFFRAHSTRATFFVVGLVAERYPELIREIVAEGHEIACHSHTHVQVDKHTPGQFREDLQRNLDALHRCGAESVTGFRAPTFSVTERTRWAYDILEELGFRYSSSVVPAPNPLYGWPEFGEDFRMVGKIYEMPLTLHPGRARLPVGGGIYFRVLPFFFLRQGMRRAANAGRAVLSYFHPYDIDTQQERFMHPDLSGNRFYNALMYIGRGRVFPRLERLLGEFQFGAYQDYLDREAG